MRPRFDIGGRWIFFRAETIAQTFEVLRALTSFSAKLANLPLPIWVLMALSLAVQWLPENGWQRLQQGFAWLHEPAQAMLHSFRHKFLCR